MTIGAIVNKVEYQRMPAMPFGFAEFVLQLNYPMHDNPTKGQVFYPGREMALEEWALVYFRDFEAVFSEYHLAVRWVNQMPSEGCEIYIDISLPERRKRTPGRMLSVEYVDCDCESSYIKAVPAGYYPRLHARVVCSTCRVTFGECPNSYASEVMNAGLPFDEHNVKVAEETKATSQFLAVNIPSEHMLSIIDYVNANIDYVNANLNYDSEPDEKRAVSQALTAIAGAKADRATGFALVTVEDWTTVSEYCYANLGYDSNSEEKTAVYAALDAVGAAFSEAVLS